MEPGSEPMRGFWKALITVPNLMAVGAFLIFVGGWQQNQASFRTQMEDRVGRLETQLNQANAENADNKVSRAVVSAQLAQIQLDIASLRVEVKDVRNEVRKIR